MVMAGAGAGTHGGPEPRDGAADLKHGLAIYEVCAGCHSTEGWGTKDGDFPMLAGQHASVIVKQLADIRAGNRDNPAMFPFATSEILDGPRSIAAVAAYIASLPMGPDNATGPGDGLEAGRRLYGENCAGCHGDNGEGSGESAIPRIQGQHYPYLVRQFKWIRDAKRRNADPDMARQIEGFTDADVSVLMDYVSRLRPDTALMAPPGWRNPDFQ
jgi:cytochrome c553